MYVVVYSTSPLKYIELIDITTTDDGAIFPCNLHTDSVPSPGLGIS